MLKFKVVIVCIWSLLFLQARAQLIDSIAKSFESRPSLYFNYGSQYSFISNQFAAVQNIKIGLDYGKTFKLGIGYNWLTKKFPLRNRTVENLYSQCRLHVNYFTVFAEYTFFRNYHWEATIPAQIGFGWANYQRVAGGVQSPNKFFIAYEPVMTIQYRFWKYFGAGCGIGFRLITINRTVIQEQMFSPIVLIKSKLFVADLWRDITKK